MLWTKFGVVNKKSEWWLKREQECCETLYGLWIERDYKSCVVKLLGVWCHSCLVISHNAKSKDDKSHHVIV